MFPLLTLPLSTAPTYLAQSLPTSSVTSLLPADTPLVGLVNSTADWKVLERFQLFQVASAGIKAFLPPSVNFNYTRDVDSWLGDEVALVLLPKVGTAEVTQNSNFLMLAPVKDESRLKQLIAQLKPSNKQQTVTEQQYKGVTILEYRTQINSTPPPPVPPKKSTFIEQFNFLPNLVVDVTPSTQPTVKQSRQDFAIALLPGYVVGASSTRAIQQLLDLPKDSKTLAQNPNFQRTIQRPQVGQKLFTLYENPTTFLPILNSFSKTPNLPLPFPSSIRLEQVKNFSSIDGFMLAQPEGLYFQVNAYRQTPKTDSLNNIPPAETTQILERLPASSYSVYNSHNLKREWQTAVATINAEPKLKPQLNQLRDFVRSSTGLDVDRDIAAWMDGDYALFTYPTKGGIANSGIGFLVQTSDRPTAEIALNKLNQFIRSFFKGAVAVTSRNLKGEPVTSWEIKEAKPSSLFAYSWVESDTLLITTGFESIQDLIPPPYQSLLKSYTFTTATKSFPSPNQGYFYLNMGSLLSWAYGLVPPSQAKDPYFRIFRQLTGTIRSVSATRLATAEQEQFDSLVVLAPAKAVPK